MDQHFPKVHDLDVALFCSPELPLGQGRGGFLPIDFCFQIYEAFDVRFTLPAAVPLLLCLTRGAGIAESIRCAGSDVVGEAIGSIH